MLVQLWKQILQLVNQFPNTEELETILCSMLCRLGSLPGFLQHSIQTSVQNIYTIYGVSTLRHACSLWIKPKVLQDLVASGPFTLLYDFSTGAWNPHVCHIFLFVLSYRHSRTSLIQTPLGRWKLF